MTSPIFRRIDSENPDDRDLRFKDEAKDIMKEITYDANKHTVASSSSSMRSVLDGLLDKMKDEACEILAKLVSEKVIEEYRVAPIGASVTMDYRAGRISITTDASGKVVDAQQG